ncbi:hypothetical protein EVAR_83485_1 [Eumeta japonica]|uniref:Uncharacterized protein n=1 Tax=Eumeta variegata TaxID=151549 RepID=A0A4C1ZE81_EUMVA|nr:hypothetical protein EVAR_83485_1 [Eumeta japonica]
MAHRQSDAGGVRLRATADARCGRFTSRMRNAERAIRFAVHRCADAKIKAHRERSKIYSTRARMDEMASSGRARRCARSAERCGKMIRVTAERVVNLCHSTERMDEMARSASNAERTAMRRYRRA